MERVSPRSLLSRRIINPPTKPYQHSNVLICKDYRATIARTGNVKLLLLVPPAHFSGSNPWCSFKKMLLTKMAPSAKCDNDT